MRTLFGTFPDKTIEELTEEARRPEPIEWVRFTGRPHPRYSSVEPRITFGRKGMFYFNDAAFRALGQPAAIEMMIDKKHRIIGMKAAEPTNESAFTVKKHGKAGRYKRIAASAFCQNFKLRTDDTLLFHNLVFDADDVLRLDLVNATKVGRGAR